MYILHVEYEDVKRDFMGEDVFELFDKAREHKLYEFSATITFDLEEVTEDGN